MSRYLKNPWETALLVALLGVGVVTPWGAAGAALFFVAAEIVAGLGRRTGPRWIPAAWPEGGRPLTVLYDGTCVLCVRSKERVERWKTASLLRFIAIQSPEAKGG